VPVVEVRFYFEDGSRYPHTFPPAVRILYWLLPLTQKQISNRLLLIDGGGYFGVAGGNWGRRLEAPQQHIQPLADPPSPDSTDPKISAFFNVTSTPLRSSTERALDLRTG